MIIKNESVYRKGDELVNYLLDKCDMISVYVYYHYLNRSDVDKVIKVISINDNELLNNLLENYNQKRIEYICDKYKDNSLIFDEEFMESAWKEDKKAFEFYKNRYIYGALRQCVDEHLANKWLMKYKSNLISKKKEYLADSISIPKHESGVRYYLKLDEKLKEEIKSKSSLYDWDSPEDICFFKDSKCLLETVSHEELCWLYCYSEDEYNLYRKMGIKFFNDEYDEKDLEYAPKYEQ